ncbi:MAG: radical SAM protein [Victivallaceae bacterium]|nr:radical SAM protein [Victivallaceae bacterium]
MSSESLIVNEWFTSLQGESTQAGRVCHFIRLSGCNLACSYCDTRYASAGTERPIADLVAAIPPGVKLVEITGGEPLCQKNTPLLAECLIDAGFEVMIETNGSLDIGSLPPGVRRIMDCKLPDSGMDGHNLWSNYGKLTGLDEVKFVVGGRDDFAYALRVVERFYEPGRSNWKILYSPVWGKVKFDDLAQWIIDAKAPGQMQIQLHKLIWGPEKTGV